MWLERPMWGTGVAALVAGLSALLTASAAVYTAVKIAGAGYLCYLGVQSLRHARFAGPEVAAGGRRRLGGNAYLQGLISTVLNPKPALFFLSYLPQFVDRRCAFGPQLAILAGIHIVLGLAWLSAYAWLVSRLQAVVTFPKVRTAMERVSGVVLVGLGVRLALQQG